MENKNTKPFASQNNSELPPQDERYLPNIVINMELEKYEKQFTDITKYRL